MKISRDIVDLVLSGTFDVKGSKWRHLLFSIQKS